MWLLIWLSLNCLSSYLLFLCSICLLSSLSSFSAFFQINWIVFIIPMYLHYWLISYYSIISVVALGFIFILLQFIVISFLIDHIISYICLFKCYNSILYCYYFCKNSQLSLKIFRFLKSCTLTHVVTRCDNFQSFM